MATVTGKAYDFPILKRIFVFTHPYKKAFWVSVFLTVLLAFLSLSRPLLVQKTVDDFIAKDDSTLVKQLEAAYGKGDTILIKQLVTASGKVDTTLVKQFVASSGKDDTTLVKQLDAAYSNGDTILVKQLVAASRKADTTLVKLLFAASDKADTTLVKQLDAAYSKGDTILVKQLVAASVLNVRLKSKIAREDGLLWMTLLMIGLLLFQTLVQYYQTFLTNWLGQVVIRDLRVKLYRHILRLRSKFFDRIPIGTLVTRMVSDLETIADVFSEGLISILGDLFTLFVIVGCMFYIDWRLTLVSLSTIPVLFWATRIFQRGIKSAFQEVRTQVAHLNTFVQEHLTGISIVQIFSKEKQEMKKFEDINRLHMKANIRSVWYYSIFFPVVELLSATSTGLLVWWGAKEVLHSNLSPGTIIMFIMFLNLIFRPIRELADKFNTLQLGMVSSERIFKLLDTDEYIPNEGKIIASDIRGDIEFRNVWFAYNDDGVSEPEWVLKNVSFSVKAGQTLALVGATGAGKSSIINLINRFYEISKGEILVDGIEIRNYELNSLRKNIAVVMQDVFLFSDTIANNISLRDPSVSIDEIKKAATVVGANRFIEQLPDDYHFNVMERGGMLSVGQRQLISFIRAYVFNPKILILDEATSSIDSESEELIQSATSKLTHNRTSIVIAHRLATIQDADKILVLDHGEKMEEGTHQELLRHGGFYKNLYEIQFSGISSNGSA